jgi:hypothetical protein
MNDRFKKLRFAVVLTLTLGLAPFYPQPHIIGKIKWLAGGGKGMQPMDYFDVVLHGGPWLYLIIILVLEFIIRKNKT